MKLELRNQTIYDLLLAYSDLDTIAYNISEGWDEDHTVTTKESQIISEINIIRDRILLAALHNILTNDIVFEETFKSSVDNYIKNNNDSLNPDDFIKSLEFYIRRYK